MYFSIRESAENFGICKIVPPKEWNPPMSIDMTDPRRIPTKKQQLNTLQVCVCLLNISVLVCERIIDQSSFFSQEGNNIFPDGEKYSAGDYKAMADRFKKDWISAHHDGNENVNMEDLEKNYWDIVSIVNIPSQHLFNHGYRMQFINN